MCVCSPQGLGEDEIPLELELQVTVSSLLWELNLGPLQE